MANFPTIYTGNGVQTTFSIPWPYLNRSHVVVKKGGVTQTFGTHYTHPTSGQVQFSVAPANGVAVSIDRITPLAPISNFTSGPLQASDLNAVTKQAQYGLEELDSEVRALGTEVDDHKAEAWTTEVPGTLAPLETGDGGSGVIRKGVAGALVGFDADGNLLPLRADDDIEQVITDLDAAEAAHAAHVAKAWTTAAGGGTITKGGEGAVPRFDASGNLVPGIINYLSGGPAFPSTFADRAEAIATAIPAAMVAFSIGAYDTTQSAFMGRSNYREASSVEYAAVPSALRLRDSGGSGRYWVINEPIIHVAMAGAVGDGVADDTAAINAAIAYMRTMIHTTTESRKFSVAAHGMSCLALGSIDATMIRGQKRWAIEGLVLHSKAAGKAAIDCTGSRFGLFRDCIFWGDVTDTPYSGVQLCRYQSSPGFYPSAGEHVFDNVVIDGYFTKTSYHNYSSEVNTHIACRFWNRYAGGYAIILDGRGTHPVVSDYVTPITASLSALEHLFLQADVRQLTSGPAMFIGQSDHIQFLNSFGVSLDDVLVEVLIGSTFHPAQWTFDMHGEVTPGMTGFMRIEASSANVKINGLTYKENHLHSETKLFEIAASVTNLEINDLNMHVSAWWNTGLADGAFDVPAKVTLKNATINVPTLAGFLGSTKLADFAGFTGAIHARDQAEVFSNGITRYSDSTAADASTARALVDYYRRGADTIGDVLHTMRFYGDDDAGNKFQYAGLRPFITNPANGSEAGSLDLVAANAGASFSGFRVGPIMNTAFLPLQLPTYTVAQLAALPAASHPRGLIYVSNETGGAVVAFSDGTGWRRVTDRAVVS